MKVSGVPLTGRVQVALTTHSFALGLMTQMAPNDGPRVRWGLRHSSHLVFNSNDTQAPSAAKQDSLVVTARV